MIRIHRPTTGSCRRGCRRRQDPRNPRARSILGTSSGMPLASASAEDPAAMSQESRISLLLQSPMPEHSSGTPLSSQSSLSPRAMSHSSRL